MTVNACRWQRRRAPKRTSAYPAGSSRIISISHFQIQDRLVVGRADQDWSAVWVNSADFFMSALRPLMPPRRRHADIARLRICPCVDGSELAEAFFTFAAWSVQACVRPLDAVHMTLAIMPSADQSRSKTRIRYKRCTSGFVLIAGSTGSALRAVRSSTSLTPDARRDLVYGRKRDGLPVTLALSPSWPRPFGHACWSRWRRLVGRRANSAVSQGRVCACGSWHSG